MFGQIGQKLREALTDHSEESRQIRICEGFGEAALRASLPLPEDPVNLNAAHGIQTLGFELFEVAARIRSEAGLASESSLLVIQKHE